MLSSSSVLTRYKEIVSREETAVVLEVERLPERHAGGFRAEMRLAQIVMRVEMDDADLAIGASRRFQDRPGDRVIAADRHRHNAMAEDQAHHFGEPLEVTWPYTGHHI